jgi:hypothetical protein
MWIPNHQLDGDKGDTRDAALEYLDSIRGKPSTASGWKPSSMKRRRCCRYLTGTGVTMAGSSLAGLFPRQARRARRPLGHRADLRRARAG